MISRQWQGRHGRTRWTASGERFGSYCTASLRLITSVWRPTWAERAIHKYSERMWVAASSGSIWTGTTTGRSSFRTAASPETRNGWLSGERKGPRPTEGLPKTGEHRQRGVNPNPVDAACAKRRQAVLILESPELALHGGAAPVEELPLVRPVGDRGKRDGATLAETDDGLGVAPRAALRPGAPRRGVCARAGAFRRAGCAASPLRSRASERGGTPWFPHGPPPFTVRAFWRLCGLRANESPSGQEAAGDLRDESA